MTNVTDQVRQTIEDNWELTNETANVIYFKYSSKRGMPKFTYAKDTQKVTLAEKVKDSQKEAISVEVKTTIYSLFKEGVEKIDAQTVFVERHTDEMKEIVKEYGGIDD
ncbi:hypothetical protein COF68_06185 [Bacillus toyonensis]|uniref:hypothetical protein n=1 Tax=Bacillus toyonensis TaxID=155322 RepID=UPI000BFB5D3C|nr:hypothetical protein [Bacillus toyonensis]PHE64422.1 hypothetical protein COF68_06185 [Bacillus toyonensis]